MDLYFWILGGLFALLTPLCLPHDSHHGELFTKDTKRKGWVNGLIYGASIIVIYVLLACSLLPCLVRGAQQTFYQLDCQHAFFFIIFIVFALSFLAFMKLPCPVHGAPRVTRWRIREDCWAYFYGIYTGPGFIFMYRPHYWIGTGDRCPRVNTWVPFGDVWLFSGAGSAFWPVCCLSGVVEYTAQIGIVDEFVKVVLGFLELALALKFLSVADMTNHWGVLKYELFMALWILVFWAWQPICLALSSFHTTAQLKTQPYT